MKLSYFWKKSKLKSRTDGLLIFLQNHTHPNIQNIKTTLLQYAA